MMRIACVLALIALTILIVVAVHLDGATATLFSFIGIPALTAALALYVIQRWRVGAFRRAPRPSTT
jgi:urea transporter